MAEIAIGPDTRVTLHFAIKLQNGDVVDSTFDKAPATFTVGDGNLLPGFEQALFGLEAGTKTSLTIPPERRKEDNESSISGAEGTAGHS